MAPRMFILLAALLWSTAGAAIKLCSLTAWQVSGGRSAVAAVTLWLLFRDARRWPAGHLWWVAVAYAACVSLFVLATKLTTAANAIFIQDCAPLYVALLSPWVLGERPTRAELLAIPVYALGMGLFFMDQLTPGQVQGNLVAMGSGVAFALSILGLRKLRDAGAPASAAWGNALAVLVALPLALPGPRPSALDLGLVLFLGVFQLALAYAAFARGLREVSAVEASLLILLEPVLNALWTWMLAGERPGSWALAGAAIVLMATVWRTLMVARL